MVRAAPAKLSRVAVCKQQKEALERRLQISALKAEISYQTNRVIEEVHQASEHARKAFALSMRDQEESWQCELPSLQDGVENADQTVRDVLASMQRDNEEVLNVQQNAERLRRLSVAERLVQKDNVDNIVYEAQSKANELVVEAEQMQREHDETLAVLAEEGMEREERALRRRAKLEKSAKRDDESSRKKILNLRRRAEEVEKRALEHDEELRVIDANNKRLAIEKSTRQPKAVNSSPAAVAARLLAQDTCRPPHGRAPGHVRSAGELGAEFPLIGLLNQLDQEMARLAA